MLFNSFTFLIFLPIVFILYWFVFQKNLKLQNAFLLIASYVFYGWWDWRFLGLIIASSALDYWCGIRMSTVDRPLSTASSASPNKKESKVGVPNADLTTRHLSTVDRGLLAKISSWLSGRKLYLTISLLFNLGLL